MFTHLLGRLKNCFELNYNSYEASCFCYEGTPYLVLRGLWFYDQSWEPLDEEMSERIELEHIHKFNGTAQQPSPIDEINMAVSKTVSLEEMSLLGGSNREDSANSLESNLQTNNDQNKISTKTNKTSSDKNDRKYFLNYKIG
jgi:hypothetical protein